MQAAEPGLSRRGRRSQESKQDILNATIDLLADRGISAVTVRAISALAGIGESSIYHFFGSREGLLSAAARELQRRGASVISVDPPSLANPRQRLLQLIENSISLIEKDPKVLRAANAFQVDGPHVPGLPDLVLHQGAPSREAAIAIFRDAAAAGIIPAFDWSVLYDVIAGAIQGAVLRNDLTGARNTPALAAVLRKAIFGLLELDGAAGTLGRDARPPRSRPRWKRIS